MLSLTASAKAEAAGGRDPVCLCVNFSSSFGYCRRHLFFSSAAVCLYAFSLFYAGLTSCLAPFKK
jgi:hypothetical protein